MPRSARRLAVVAATGSLALAACGGPEPRTFNDFIADPIARDGALARCNADRERSLRDVECANARRAAAAVAVLEERERQAQLERESERKLEEIRKLVAWQQQREREAAEAAAAAAEAAYERLWLESQGAEADGPAGALSPDREPASEPGAENERAEVRLPFYLTPETEPVTSESIVAAD